MTKIVIVDNNKDAGGIYLDTLKCAGYNVSYIGDEEKAIETISKDCPDLVLLDVLMPKINGLHILDMVAKDRCNTKTRVVMLTNVADSAIQKKAMSAGARDYIVKTGVSMSELLQRIDKALS